MVNVTVKTKVEKKKSPMVTLTKEQLEYYQLEDFSFTLSQKVVDYYDELQHELQNIIIPFFKKSNIDINDLNDDPNAYLSTLDEEAMNIFLGLEKKQNTMVEDLLIDLGADVDGIKAHVNSLYEESDIELYGSFLADVKNAIAQAMIELTKTGK